tara:strand:- start:15844 stop:16401 length:558 start_codon:yes stop_codon:yes gene_type:complete
MNYLLVFILILIVILLTTNMEMFTETFGLSGYTKPVSPVKLNDPRPNLDGFEEFEVSLKNDAMEDFVLKANNEISKRTGVCTYIIETTAVKAYRKEGDEIYELMFMVMKKGGFSFGFSVVASFEVKNGKSRIISLRTQPIGVEAPGDVRAFTESSAGKEFVQYELVKEAAVPNQSELESAKNKLQ